MKKKGKEERGRGGWEIKQGKTKRVEFSVKLLFLQKEVKTEIIIGKYTHFIVNVT